MNIISTLIDDQISDLTKLNWLNADKASLFLKPPSLPSNVKILGAPLPPAQVGSFLPKTGAMSWEVDGKPITDAFVRLVIDSKTFMVRNPAGQVAQFEVDKGTHSLGWTARYDVSGQSVPFYMRQVAQPNRDGLAIQIGFMAPVNIPKFSYEYVFYLKSGIDGIRLGRQLLGTPPDIAFSDFPIMAYPKTDLVNPSDTLFFLSGKEIKASFIFRDLLTRSLGAYWKIESIDGSLAFVLGFHFLGLLAGQPFTNDGYFGLGAGNATWTFSNYLDAMRFQNTVATGTLTQIELLSADTTPSGDARLGVYADSAGAAGALLLDAGAVAVANNTWCIIGSLSLAVTLNTYYWLAFVPSADSDFRYQTAQPASSHYYRAYTYGALPDHYGTPGGVNSNQYVMRAYVTTVAGTILPQMMAHHGG